ncbi:MAG: hypothetical protein ACYC0P_13985 [Thiobacillus sp.]
MHERHGSSNTRLYKIWCAMRDRCYRTNNQNYARYGGRGIAVCDEWRRSFVGFQRWALENGYRSDNSIDRIDGDGPYHPDNCRWATDKMQARNKSEAKSNLMVEHDGKRMNLSEWSRATNIGYTTLVRRYKKGLRGKDLLRPTKTMQSSRLVAVREQNNGSAALTDGQVVFIRNSDETGVALAKRFKVSEATISMIRSRQRRQDVPI